MPEYSQSEKKKALASLCSLLKSFVTQLVINNIHTL